MTLKNEGGTLIHYPSKPDFFEFDCDVAEVFDNMAERSIPMYHESHRVNAKLAAHWLRVQWKADPTRTFSVMDVGASTGGFLEALYHELHSHKGSPIDGISLHALDPSRAMLDKLSEKMPHVITYEHNVETMTNVCLPFDIINCSYVLQFLRPSLLVQAVDEMRHCLKERGLIFVSQKEKIISGWADAFQNNYIDFRKENGYSDEEIEAKTKALAGSMFPQPMSTMREVLYSQRFSLVQETTRWLQFSSLVAVAV